MTPTGTKPPSALDERLAPGYYLPAPSGHPIVSTLMSCATIFDIKPAMASLLDTMAADASKLPSGEVESEARISGPVIVERGARIESGSRVIGPVLVCSGAVITAGALVRDHTIIGPECRVGFGAEITRSLLVRHVSARHTCFIGDSILGTGVNIASSVTTTGLRVGFGPVPEPATEEITITLDDQRIGTGQTKFGAVIGDSVNVPASTTLSPGTLIGCGVVIYPRMQLGGFLPCGSRVR